MIKKYLGKRVFIKPIVPALCGRWWWRRTENLHDLECGAWPPVSRTVITVFTSSIFGGRASG
ncbi:hypothetical protein, partial [Acidithiobacillus ferriphilus]|uniref:hypothetical protein n=1 Tax=Acidithiobacillus ferriphilus TaxID=1689834 RepID=UPI001C065C67